MSKPTDIGSLEQKDMPSFTLYDKFLFRDVDQQKRRLLLKCNHGKATRNHVEVKLKQKKGHFLFCFLTASIRSYFCPCSAPGTALLMTSRRLWKPACNDSVISSHSSYDSIITVTTLTHRSIVSSPPGVTWTRSIVEVLESSWLAHMAYRFTKPSETKCVTWHRDIYKNKVT